MWIKRYENNCGEYANIYEENNRFVVYITKFTINSETPKCKKSYKYRKSAENYLIKNFFKEEN